MDGGVQVCSILRQFNYIFFVFFPVILIWANMYRQLGMTCESLSTYSVYVARQ